MAVAWMRGVESSTKRSRVGSILLKAAANDSSSKMKINPWSFLAATSLMKESAPAVEVNCAFGLAALESIKHVLAS